MGWLTSREHFVQLLLEDPRADLNAADTDGNTPLHWAVMYDQLKITYFLLMRGVDASRVNNIGKRAEDIARDEQSPAILHLFVDSPARPELSAFVGLHQTVGAPAEVQV